MNGKSIVDDNVVYGSRINIVCQVSSFLGTEKVGTEHKLKLSLMYPWSGNS